ncbi:MAG: beta-ketoacyl-[acyl-carrier-protein] synthase family protein [Deltaproteobacteria bacterium]|nr:beta-ketoacyl-[acyl-carrier-protein] synthase family protein [Deltaproteobacteria bacterium]
MQKRRVVITGMGVVSAVGNEVPIFWRSLKEGCCGIKPITIFNTSGYRSHNGGEVDGLSPERHFSLKELRRLSRCDQFGIVAAREAINSSGIELANLKRERFGIILGADSGGIFSMEKYFRTIYTHAPKRPSPSLLVSFALATTTDHIAQEFDMRGPRTTTATVCSSSSAAIAFAHEAIVYGEAELMITGGSDSLCEVTYAGFNSLRAIDPKGCRPFDKNRQGLSLGEGAGILILEELEHARARGARIWGEVLGYGVCAEAHHLTAPEPSGEGIARTIRLALTDAGVSPKEVDYINTHGTGTPLNDLVETRGVKMVFGKRAYEISLSSIKSMIGHCLGSGGGIEAIATLLSLQEGVIPPTINYSTPDPECDLDYTPNEARKREIHIAVSNSFAFGGNNVCLVFGRVGCPLFSSLSCD